MILTAKPIKNETIPYSALTGAPGFKDLEGFSVIVLGETQVLGGGNLTPVFTPNDPDSQQAVVHECWAVSDLTGEHWAHLLPDVDLLVVGPRVAAAIRSTILRFSASFKEEIHDEKALHRNTRETLLAALREVVVGFK